MSAPTCIAKRNTVAKDKNGNEITIIKDTRLRVRNLDEKSAYLPNSSEIVTINKDDFIIKWI